MTYEWYDYGLPLLDGTNIKGARQTDRNCVRVAQALTNKFSRTILLSQLPSGTISSTHRQIQKQFFQTRKKQKNDAKFLVLLVFHLNPNSRFLLCCQTYQKTVFLVSLFPYRRRFWNEVFMRKTKFISKDRNQAIKQEISIYLYFAPYFFHFRFYVLPRLINTLLPSMHCLWATPFLPVCISVCLPTKLSTYLPTSLSSCVPVCLPTYLLACQPSTG